jgi:endonuclease/exonuclease/phosphatase family metal-dependent hydrolase
VRIVTYNIRHGQGVGGYLSLPRVSRVILRLAPDVAVLNEVYRWPPRFDQPARLAELTGCDVLFQANARHGPADFGNVILSRHRLSLVEDVKLPKGIDPRGCLIADVGSNGHAVRIAATHLAVGRAPRRMQIQALALLLRKDDVPLVLAGDMNCPAEDLSPLRTFLDMPKVSPATFPSLIPVVSLDHILFSHHWRSADVGVVRTLASDHLPLYADLELVRPADSRGRPHGGSQVRAST